MFKIGKFKVGDTVRVIKSNGCSGYDKYIGNIGKIERIDGTSWIKVSGLGLGYDTYWQEDSVELVRENKSLKLEDIKIGMKVVPFKKTKGVSYDQWEKDPEETYNYFKENGYLFIERIDDNKIVLTNNKPWKVVVYFDISDLKLYEEPKNKNYSIDEFMGEMINIWDKLSSDAIDILSELIAGTKSMMELQVCIDKTSQLNRKVKDTYKINGVRIGTREEVKKYFNNLLTEYDHKNAFIRLCQKHNICFNNSLYARVSGNINFLGEYIKNLNMKQYENKTYEDSMF